MNRGTSISIAISVAFIACAGATSSSTSEDGLTESEKLATCPVSTGYPGDEAALCEPDPSLGMQLHYGPRDYDNPDEVNAYLLGPGEEDENCAYLKSPNTKTTYINEYHGRMRPHSHHLIVFALDEPHEDGLGPCVRGLGTQFFTGSQFPSLDIPPIDAPAAPEHVGLARKIEPNTQLVMDLHYLNTTSEPLLREAWLNFLYADSSDVTALVDAIFHVDFDIVVPPQSRTIERSVCTTDVERRILNLTGHMHGRGVRFSAWRIAADGKETLLYETYDWNHPALLYYDSVTVNASPDPASKQSGGASGEVVLAPGDSFVWECEFENPSDDTFYLGDSAQTDEMCNQFGAYYPSTDGQWQCTTFEPGTSEPLPTP